MNPTINSRWGRMCPSCNKPLLNPNQPWPQPCPTCGQRVHLKCTASVHEWLVNLDINLDPDQNAQVCIPCFKHADHNLRLIDNIPHASGDVVQDIYKRFKAQQPQAPARPVQSLYGDYRVDAQNFVPAVSKVMDIVHAAGPKIRWNVRLADWVATPATNLDSKEIVLPNYFDSPNALGRTHQEILDAMTGAAMHEAGHAAYDKIETIIAIQKRVLATTGRANSWAAALCLNIVCDYNLERKVINRYPAFRHYFQESHRWSVRDSLPSIVRSLTEDGAEDTMNVRLSILVWELLGPGDLEAAGAVLTPRLKWLTNKCFDILKYAYTRGLLEAEPGKLKTAMALYELIRVVNPVGAPPVTIHLPVPLPQPPPGPKIGTAESPDLIITTPGSPEGSPGEGDSETDPKPAEDSDDDVHSADGRPDPGTDTPGSPGGDDAGTEDEGDPGPDGEEEAGRGREEAGGEASEPTRSGDPESDGDGAGPDPDGDGDEADGAAPGGQPGDSSTEAGEEGSGEASTETQDNADDASNGHGSVPGDDDGPAEAETAGQPVAQDRTEGGVSGSAQPLPANDPFEGKGDLETDPNRKPNARKDALDELNEENEKGDKLDEFNEPHPLGIKDELFEKQHREEVIKASRHPDIITKDQPKDWALDAFVADHELRIRELAPVISQLKKVLRFRNVDWGGKQTGRRSGTLTRRHVARLSALGSDKVFHSKQPDATPKVRIALLIDESQSMQYDANSTIPPYQGARNAATAITQALKGIRGVKLWSWGYSMNPNPMPKHGSPRQVPFMRQYGDPFHGVNPASIEAYPMMGGTPTGEAMDYAAEVITAGSGPDELKVVFIITDGESGGYVTPETAVRKWTGKVRFVHLGIGPIKDATIPFYVGPVLDVSELPELLDKAVAEILT